MTGNEQLMPVTCEEEWEVSMGKQNFTLNRKQVDLLKAATTSGKSGLIWFDDLAISIPHINSISLKRRDYFKLKDGISRKISKSDYEKLSKKDAIILFKPWNDF